MKIKIDENLPASIAQLFVERGHDAETAESEGLAGAIDDVIADEARREDRLLVTLDKGFGDLRRYPPGSHPGIVVLRLPDQRTPLVSAAVRAMLEEYPLEELRSCITIVQPNAIRIRRPAI